MKISLITVTFNSERYLDGTFDSVLAQTFTDIDYIVVDGSSTDGTVGIIEKYEPFFGGRMRWVSEPDSGMYDALNKGIRMASGEIVGILNSDDFFHRTDILEKVNETFESDSSVRAVYGDVKFVNPKDISRTVRYYSSGSWRPWQLRFGFMPAHPSFYTYRSNFESFGYYKLDYSISADFELVTRHLVTNSVPYKYLPLDFVTMRTGGKSTRGLKSFWILSREDARGCRENGIWSCTALMLLRGFSKVLELLVSLFRK